MAAHNEEQYISRAIQSVIRQTYANWELLIIDNGSSDSTVEISKSFSDSRIRILSEKKLGVSRARNLGLLNMTGDFFCFLDADDCFTVDSIEVRIKEFKKDKTIDFVDGSVVVFNETFTNILRISSPIAQGEIFKNLIALDSDCFFGPTWMIKRDSSKTYQFKEELKHGEDLYFFITIARGKRYRSIPGIILKYGKRENSAMSNFIGLASGYHMIYELLKTNFQNEISWFDLLRFDFKRRKIMFLIFLSKKEFIKGLEYLTWGKTK